MSCRVGARVSIWNDLIFAPPPSLCCISVVFQQSVLGGPAAAQPFALDFFLARCLFNSLLHENADSHPTQLNVLGPWQARMWSDLRLREENPLIRWQPLKVHKCLPLVTLLHLSTVAAMRSLLALLLAKCGTYVGPRDVSMFLCGGPLSGLYIEMLKLDQSQSKLG